MTHSLARLALGAADPNYGTIPEANELSPTPVDLALRDGLVTSAAAFDDAQRAVLSGDREALIASGFASLAGLIDAYTLILGMRAANGMTAQFPNRTPTTLFAEFGAENWGLSRSTPPNLVQQYAAAIQRYVNTWWPTVALERQRIAEAQVVRDVWAQGETVINGMRFANSLIIDKGEFPDGIAYVIENGPPWNPTDRTLYTYGTERYNPAEGAWFASRFGGGRFDARPVPSWYTGDFAVSPLVRAAFGGGSPASWPITQIAIVRTVNDNLPGTVLPSDDVQVLPGDGGATTTPTPASTRNVAKLVGGVLAVLVLGAVATHYDAQHARRRQW